MEITSADMDHLVTLLTEWQTNDKLECEATFGGADVTAFLRVAARLKSKGFVSVEEEPYLTISLPDQIRLRIDGLPAIEEYCREETSISSQAFTAMMKDRATGTHDTIDFTGYDLRVKARRELPMERGDQRIQTLLAQWEGVPKYFRLIRRWKFSHPTRFPHMSFELSMVRSTKPREIVRGGQTAKVATVKRFQDQTLATFAPTYEIECEIVHSDMYREMAPKQVAAQFLKGLGEVLRGIQNSPLLIRKVVKEQVLREYMTFTGTDRFRGNAPNTMVKDNMLPLDQVTPEIPNIRRGYNVTDKADGLRTHAFVTESGELFLIDMGMNVYRTGLVARRPECRRCLLDGEYVTEDKNGNAVNMLLLFDFYKKQEEDVSQLPFRAADETGRHTLLQEWIRGFAGEGGQERRPGAVLQVEVKRFFFDTSADGSDIFGLCRDVLRSAPLSPYNRDGLILTPNLLPLPTTAKTRFKEQFKWKPAKDNTVDFLVKLVNDEEGQPLIQEEIQDRTQKSVSYMTLTLFVGSAENPALENPRQTILQQLPYGELRDSKTYRAVPFIPVEFPNPRANLCRVEVQQDPVTEEFYIQTHDTEEPIRDGSIVEMSYKPTNPDGWRWIPNRIRADKTARFLSGTISSTLNDNAVAQDTWISIHDPITEYMIQTGSTEPSEEESREIVKVDRGEQVGQRSYFSRKAMTFDQSKTTALRNFHREIKESILYNALFRDGRRTLLDLAVGQANDLQIIHRRRAKFVFGIDYADSNIREKGSGAYARYINKLQADAADKTTKAEDRIPVPTCVFAIGDCSRRLLTGEAADLPEEAAILRAVLGGPGADGDILPPYVQQEGIKGRLAEGADGIACMFAIHYFFESATKFDGFLQNIADNLKVGGYFVGCCFDGQTVFQKLSIVLRGGTVNGFDGMGTPLWTITKEYDSSFGATLPIDDSGFGYPISVKFATIGEAHREYLVPWELLVAKMKTIGCVLAPLDELSRYKIEHNTNMFGNSHTMLETKHKDPTKRKRFQMYSSVKEYSFLNRWFIFKRVSQTDLTVAEAPPVGAVSPAYSPHSPTFGMNEAMAEAEARVAVAAGEAAAEAKPESEDTCVDEVERAAEAAQKAEETELKALEAAVEPRTEAAEEAEAEGGPGAGAGTAVPARKLGTVAYTPRTDFMTSLKKEEVDQAELAAKVAADAKVPYGTRGRTYKKSEILYFSLTQKEEDILGLGDPFAVRWMAPGAHYPIVDEDTVYPSVSHFIAGRITNAPSLFDTTSKLHIEATEAKPKTTKETYELWFAEEKRVTEDLTSQMKKMKLDDAIYKARLQEALEEGYRQRFQKDAKFCQVVDKVVHGKQRYPVYYTGAKPGTLGGALTAKQTLQGGNMVGDVIYKYATAHPDTLKTCAAGTTAAAPVAPPTARGRPAAGAGAGTAKKSAKKRT